MVTQSQNPVTEAAQRPDRRQQLLLYLLQRPFWRTSNGHGP